MAKTKGLIAGVISATASALTGGVEPDLQAKLNRALSDLEQAEAGERDALDAVRAVPLPCDARMVSSLPESNPRRKAFEEAREKADLATHRRRQARESADRAQAALQREQEAQERASRPPVRRRLADAIEARANAERAAEAVRVAIEQAAENVRGAEAKLQAATAAVAVDRKKQTHQAEEAALAGKAVTSAGWGDVVTRQADAEAELVAARAAHSSLIATGDERQHACGRLDREVAELGDEVLRSTSVTALLADARRLQEELISRRIVLRYLRREGLVDEADAYAVRLFLSDLSTIPVDAADISSGSDESDAWNTHEAMDPWRAAREALRLDANAPLPMA